MTDFPTHHSPAAASLDDAAARLERLARKRAGAKMGWYIHALVYVCVNAGLALISVGSGRPWFIFPLGGWGLGLAMHGLAVFLAPWLFALRDRMAEDELRRLKSRQPEAGDPPR